MSDDELKIRVDDNSLDITADQESDLVVIVSDNSLDISAT